MFATDRSDDRLTLRRDGTRWLSSGFDGGFRDADAAHNLTVPAGFDRTDLSTYAAERLAGRPTGPTLLTGVEQTHARGARLDAVEVVATAGLSNPAVLPLDLDGGARPETDGSAPGTVNLFVGTTRNLDDGALAGLLATAVEAKTATLSAVAGISGTTSDAVVVGCDPTGEPAAFAGSATPVGAATRACVREAIRASLESRYEDDYPTPDDTEHGVVTNRRANVFDLV